MYFVITGKFVTSDNIAIPGTSLPEVNLLYIDPIDLNNLTDITEYKKEKITIADDGTFIIPLTSKILGFATTIEEIVKIVDEQLKIYIMEDRGRIAEYKRGIKSTSTTTVSNEVINGKSKFKTSGEIIILDIGNIILKYYTPPVASLPPPIPKTITFSDIPIASDASLLFNPSTASFFILKGVVKDNESKLPIPDVSVHLTSVNYFSQGTTDNNGVFYIPTEKSTLTELDILSTSIYEQLEFTIPTDKQLTFSGYQEIILDSTLTPSPTSFPVFEYSDFFLKKKNIEEEVIDEASPSIIGPDSITNTLNLVTPELANAGAIPLPSSPSPKIVTTDPLTGVTVIANPKNKIRNTLVGIVVDENGEGIEKANIVLKYYPFDISSPDIKPLLLQQIQLASPVPLPLDLANSILSSIFEKATPEQAMNKFIEKTGVDLRKKVRATTNSTGNFEIVLTKKNGNIKISLQGASIEVESPNYNKSTILLTNLNSTTDKNPYKNGKILITTQYSTGRISLTPATLNALDEEQIKTRIKRQAAASDEEGTPEQKLTKLNIRKFNSALDKLIPFLTSLLLPFGQAAVTAAFGNGQIEKAFCPSSERLTTIINARNSVATQINILYNGLRVLTQLSNTTDVFITSLTTALQAYPLLPIPANILTVGAISVIEDRKKSLEEDLKIRRVILRGITRIIVYCVAILAYVITILTILDRLIQGCAEEQNIPFIALNPEITNITNPVSNELIENPPMYKGFKLEIKLDLTNNLSYPRRYAQALNLQGVPVLKTDSSFASDPQILIDQLKFIIDSDPNLTAG